MKRPITKLYLIISTIILNDTLIDILFVHAGAVIAIKMTININNTLENHFCVEKILQNKAKNTIYNIFCLYSNTISFLNVQNHISCCCIYTFMQKSILSYSFTIILLRAYGQRSLSLIYLFMYIGNIPRETSYFHCISFSLCYSFAFTSFCIILFGSNSTYFVIKETKLYLPITQKEKKKR